MNLKRYCWNPDGMHVVESEDNVGYRLASDVDATLTANADEIRRLNEELTETRQRAAERLRGMAEHAHLEGDELHWWNDKPHQVLWHLVKNRKSDRDEICRLRERVEQLEQLIVDADWVSRERFAYHGLCDALDNNGGPYPSQWSADIVKSIDKKPIKNLADALAAEQAREALTPADKGGV